MEAVLLSFLRSGVGFPGVLKTVGHVTERGLLRSVTIEIETAQGKPQTILFRQRAGRVEITLR